MFELAWLGRDKIDGNQDMNGKIGASENGRHVTGKSGSEGYLFVGDSSPNGLKCSVYELDLDEIKDGESVQSRKDLQMDHFYPKCSVDCSALFGIEGDLDEGIASVVKPEFE
ncbi:uncharacterized protein LOC142358010 [Convolutriloba macropyga]|uniref:uncharacterized protein LOC142358010 n=1 Tax=Convolutriloba macropyga TaxID=536237 RepID=UPI003F51B3D5